MTDWNKEYSHGVRELAAERARATQWLRERDEAREAIRNALTLLEEAGCGCHGEPIPTAMRVLSLALKDQQRE